MAHHKRHRPKHQRAGCLMCKPQKDERQPKRATSPYDVRIGVVRAAQRAEYVPPRDDGEPWPMFGVYPAGANGYHCGDPACEECRFDLPAAMRIEQLTWRPFASRAA